MKASLLLLALFLLSSLATAQDAARSEVYAGYSYLSADTNGLKPPRQSYNGWQTSFAMRLNRWISAESDIGSYSQNFNLLGTGTTSVNLNMRGYDFLAGPRVSFRPVFVHALFGIDRLSASAPGVDATQNRFASALGGGVQWYFSRYLGLRTSADYVLTHHNLFGGSSALQNNLRASAGIVYRFGGIQAGEKRRPIAQKQEPQAPREAKTSPVQPPARVPLRKETRTETGDANTVARLGIRTSTAPGGVKVEEVERNTVAEFAGLQPGDVINSVDEKPVRTAAELSSMLSGLAPGTKVKLGFLIKGYWHTETTVVMQ
jgi:outer membrane protein with beta-barrel domain/PDZ domain-containing protein